VNARRFPILEILLAVAAASLFIAVNYQNESRKKAIAYDTYSTYDTRNGGYAAWFDLMQRLGAAPERFEEYPAFLDAGVATLVVSNPLPFPRPVAVSDASAAALVRWMRDGGRLVLLGSGGAVSEALESSLAQPQAAKGKGVPFVAPAYAAAGIKNVKAPGDDRFRSGNGYHTVLADAHGAIVVQRTVGRGELVAVSDELMLANGWIGRGDNARLAALLARTPRAGALAFDEALHGHLAPEHWWEIVPRAFLVALGFTLGAVALAAIGAAIRLGPPIEPPAGRAATSREYIDALGALLQGARASQHAATTAYVSTRRAVARRFGLADDVPDRLLRERLGTPALQAAFGELATLAGEPALRDASLVRAVSLAYEIRKDVARAGT
jgi:hypothetical protein